MAYLAKCKFFSRVSFFFIVFFFFLNPNNFYICSEQLTVASRDSYNKNNWSTEGFAEGRIKLGKLKRGLKPWWIWKVRSFKTKAMTKTHQSFWPKPSPRPRLQNYRERDQKTGTSFREPSRQQSWFWKFHHSPRRRSRQSFVADFVLSHVQYFCFWWERNIFTKVSVYTSILPTTASCFHVKCFFNLFREQTAWWKRGWDFQNIFQNLTAI